MRVGFLINPIAGMGGRVGLKGTDEVVPEALRRGATRTSGARAAEALSHLRDLLSRAPAPPAVEWITCTGAMGADVLATLGFDIGEVIRVAAGDTSRNDTTEAAGRMRDAKVDLILFCGGDGTARDIAGTVGRDTPILGIPAGVKMYSGAFGTTPSHAADLLFAFLEGRVGLADVEVLDLDEERYRGGEWVVRLYHAARTPFEASLTQASKSMIAGASDADAKADIAKYLVEEFEDRPDVLLLLGAGTTVEAVGAAWGIDKTLLGIDAVAGGAQVGQDLNERGILDLLARYPERRLILSPIGAQGFVLGRGNLQISPEAIRRIGRDNLIVVATPAKIAETPVLHFDTGDAALDAVLFGDGYLPVVTGYGLRRRVRIGE